MNTTCDVLRNGIEKLTKSDGIGKITTAAVLASIKLMNAASGNEDWTYDFKTNTYIRMSKEDNGIVLNSIPYIVEEAREILNDAGFFDDYDGRFDYSYGAIGGIQSRYEDPTQFICTDFAINGRRILKDAGIESFVIVISGKTDTGEEVNHAILGLKIPGQYETYVIDASKFIGRPNEFNTILQMDDIDEIEVTKANSAERLMDAYSRMKNLMYWDVTHDEIIVKKHVQAFVPFEPQSGAAGKAVTSLPGQRMKFGYNDDGSDAYYTIYAATVLGDDVSMPEKGYISIDDKDNESWYGPVSKTIEITSELDEGTPERNERNAILDMYLMGKESRDDYIPDDSWAAGYYTVNKEKPNEQRPRKLIR